MMVSFNFWCTRMQWCAQDPKVRDGDQDLGPKTETFVYLSETRPRPLWV